MIQPNSGVVIESDITTASPSRNTNDSIWVFFNRSFDNMASLVDYMLNIGNTFSNAETRSHTNYAVLFSPFLAPSHTK